MIDIDGLLKEISPETPCGDDLEYDAAYGALERATQGKPEQQFGNTVVPAEGPDWAQVQREASDLLGRTKDLRVAAYLTQALIRVQGWEGLRDGLSLIKGLLERYWEGVHPQLDPDDDLDPTLRVNTIATLADPKTSLEGLRAAPLVSARGIGAFGLRDLQHATKAVTEPADKETPAPQLQVIEAAFQGVELDALRATAEAIGQSRKLVAGIETLLLEQVGVGAAPDLAALNAVIAEAQKAVAAPLAQRTGQPIESEDLSTEPSLAETPGLNPSDHAVVSAAPGAIKTRGDVVRTLELLCEYYRREEPSSPIPLLLNRAKRLVSKDFIEILRDLAPDGLAQAEVIRGPDADESA